MLDASDFVLRNHFRFFVVQELVHLMAFWSPFFSFSMAVGVKEKSLANRMEANVTWTKSTSSSYTVHLWVMSAMCSSTYCLLDWFWFQMMNWPIVSTMSSFDEFMTSQNINEWMLVASFPSLSCFIDQTILESIAYPTNSSQMFVTPNDVWSAEWRGLCTSYQIYNIR